MPAKKQKGSDAPFSIRFTQEERADLEKRAGTLSLAAFIRWLLFDEKATERMRSTRKLIKDYQLIAQILALLKRTQIPAGGRVGSTFYNPGDSVRFSGV